MTLNPPRREPTIVEKIRKEASHYREVILFAAGIILGRLLGL